MSPAKKPNKRAAAASASKGQPTWFRHVAIAVVAWVVLTFGYMVWPRASAGDAAPAFKAQSAAASSLGPAPSGPSAVCPAGWADCPRVAGVDWPALLARERAAETQPSAATLALCEAQGLLSAQTVPGMHLVCVLPPPPASAAAAPGAEASATLAIFDGMLRSAAPPRVLLLPANLRDGAHLVAAVQRSLGFERGGKTPSGEYQPAAMFTDRGVRIVTVAGLLGLLTVRMAIRLIGNILIPRPFY